MNPSRPARGGWRLLSLVVAALAAVAGAAPASALGAGSCWWPPVVGVVVDPFREPACPYCSGNRGLEYRIGRDTPVRAVAAGIVSWAGSVAGVRYVIVRHADGRRITYGHLESSSVTTGQPVVAGALIGRASGSFHFGVRDGDRYVDPAHLLGRVVTRPRLVPLDATPARPSPTVLRCDSASSQGRPRVSGPSTTVVLGIAPDPVVLRRGPR